MYMDTFEKQFKIAKLLLDNGWTIKDISFMGRDPIVASKNYIDITISTEQCECHGGRIWIECEHLHNCAIIEHSSYDKDLGIVDPKTELNWEIENELIPELNKLNSFIYKVSKINEYSDNIPEHESINYFNSWSEVSRFITGNSYTDINDISTGSSIVIKYPNPNRQDIITKIHKECKYSWDKNKIWFKVEHQMREDSKEDFKTQREFEIYVDTFKK